MSAELVTWRSLAPQAWKNGAGTTREIAAEPPGAGLDGFAWRLNVMVRRGRHRAEVQALDARRSARPALAGLLACLGGRWRCTGHDAVLDTGQALLWRHGLPALDIEPAAPGLAVLVRIA